MDKKFISKMAPINYMFSLYIFTILHNFQKSFFFQKNPNKKALQQNAKGFEIVKLSLLDSFGTFCWGEIIEELQNTYKLKELINLPVRVPNNV